jgi:putative transposase
MTMRYEAIRQDDPVLRERLKELARVRRRFGYRRLHVFLRREGHVVKHKRLFRIYRDERLHVRRHGGRKRAIGLRAPMALSLMPNQRWSLDFVSDQLTDGRRFRIMTVVDDCTRECFALIADTSLSGARVARELATLFEARGKPMTVVSDNGTEFTSNAILTFADDRKINWHYIAPGKPTQKELQWSSPGRALERDTVCVPELCPRHARGLAHGQQHRTPPLPPRLADACRLRRDLHPATGPGGRYPCEEWSTQGLSSNLHYRRSGLSECRSEIVGERL